MWLMAKWIILCSLVASVLVLSHHGTSQLSWAEIPSLLKLCISRCILTGLHFSSAELSILSECSWRDIPTSTQRDKPEPGDTQRDKPSQSQSTQDLLCWAQVSAEPGTRQRSIWAAWDDSDHEEMLSPQQLLSLILFPAPHTVFPFTTKTSCPREVSGPAHGFVPSRDPKSTSSTGWGQSSSRRGVCTKGGSHQTQPALWISNFTPFYPTF